MARRLILDTDVLIEYERGSIDRAMFDDDELAVASITVAEFRVGIELAATPERAAERARILAVLLSVVDVLDYTEATAAHHARLIADVRRQGAPRGAHDLIIAAHALQTDRTIVSRDAVARFGTLPGVRAEAV
ncbi:type II toxin-antitoxin system VapC family toxin [Microbacterium luticocti]|uniref:type II toxin-antitoxin system VapC family toxin n=1 Tax=Microbacterium luticocti TaxID=451764 RepID=UPI00041FF893|nr:type II toxin-antitoxin system VapC family toxin [Microbacterium luticocti]